MLRRLFWMAVGAGATVYVWRRSKSGLLSLLPSGFARAFASRGSSDTYSSPSSTSPASSASATGSVLSGAGGFIADLARGAGNFAADFQAAQREREAELRTALLAQEPRGANTPAGGRNRSRATYDPDVPGDRFASAGRVSTAGRAGAHSKHTEHEDDSDDEIYEF